MQLYASSSSFPPAPLSVMLTICDCVVQDDVLNDEQQLYARFEALLGKHDFNFKRGLPPPSHSLMLHLAHFSCEDRQCAITLSASHLAPAMCPRAASPSVSSSNSQLHRRQGHRHSFLDRPERSLCGHRCQGCRIRASR